MKKIIPSFAIWEASVSNQIELYKLDKMEWNFDRNSVDKFKEKRDISDCKIYKASDPERYIQYTFKTWFEEGFYNIVLVENNKIVFANKYFREDKAYYDQDCEIILGFKIKF